MNIAARLHQRRWLPRELAYELLLFVPGTFCGARHLLTTSAIIFRLISGGKYANNWRRSYDVMDRESVYRSRQIGALNKRPLLPRIHRHQLPSPWFNFHNYAFYREDNIMTLQVILILDRRFFSSALDFIRLRENFCRRVDEELSLPWIGLVQRADAWHEPTQEYDLLIINYFPVGDEQFTTSLTTILNDLTNFMDVQYPADVNTQNPQ
uniref:Uncharacterized protein n=3 Tax=Globodera pallida TaxID=36090 RepID=A0A183BJT6_GLOPA